MRKIFAVAMVALFAVMVPAVNARGGIDRLYVIECGERTVADVSPWTPGVPRQGKTAYYD